MMATRDSGARHAADDVVRTTVRLPADVAETLRTYVYLTHDSANSAMVQAIRDFLSTTGRDRMVQASTRDTVTRFGAVLDKLGDS